MKKLLFILFITCTALVTNAQQDQHYSQYMFNGLVINPAYAGSNEMISAGLFHRTQWVGFGESSTQSFSIHSPVLHESVGIGLHILNDKAGALKNTSIITSYAYKLNVRKGILSMGLQGGVMNYALDNSNIDVKDLNDPKLNTFSAFKPDIGFGTYYLRKNYYVGVSVSHLIQSKINDQLGTDDFAQLTRHYYLTAAYQYQINRDFSLIPSIMFKTLRFAPKFVSNSNSNFQTSALDLTTHIKYKKMIWFGVTYRMADSFNAQIGTDISRLVKGMGQGLKIGYAYDLTTSKLKNYNSGTHEIMMVFDFELKPKANAVNKDIHYISPRLF